MREQRQLVEAQIELALLSQSKQLLENLQLWDGFGGSDLYDQLRPRSNDAGSGAWVPLSIASDRRKGANWPLWRTEQDLGRFRQQSRVLCGLGGYAWGMLDNLVNYIVGDGCSYEVATLENLPDADPEQPGQQIDEWLAGQVAKAQDVVDRFLRVNRWTQAQSDRHCQAPLAGSREQETVRRVYRDGEAFWRLFRQADSYGPYRRGDCLIRFVEPEQVVTGGKPDTEGWGHGVQHQIQPFEDVETVVNYNVVYMDPAAPNEQAVKLQHDSLGEVVPAEQIIHLKGPHTDSTVKRGTPYFIGDTAEAFARASKLQRAVSMGAAIRASTAETWKHATGTQAQISNLASSLAERQRTNPVTGAQENVERIGPGAIRRIDAGWEPVQPTTDQSAQYQNALQGDLKQGAAAFCAPEYLVSADASNANYASTREAGTPFVRAGSSAQGYFTGAFARACWAALEWAAECDLIDRRALSYLTIQVKAPVIAMRSELERAQEDGILIPLNVKSIKTAQMERGLSPDEEDANNQEHEEKFGSTGPALPMPGGGGAPKPPSPGAGGSEGADPFRESWERLREAEEKGGQFKKGGGRVGAGPGGAQGGEPAKKKPLEQFRDVGGQLRNNTQKILVGVSKGEYDHADAKADIGIEHDRAAYAAHGVMGAFYNQLKRQAVEQFGEAAVASPEWKAVRGAFDQALEKANAGLGDIASVSRGIVDHHEKHGAMMADAAAQLRKAHGYFDEQRAEGSRGVWDAVDAFVAKWRK